MNIMKLNYLLFSILLLTLIDCSVNAASNNNSTIEKGHEVHYNALSTTFLTPEVSKNYQIGRSKTTGFVNISVLKQVEGEVSQPVEAEIIIDAKNVYGQNKNVELRKISENDGAIYYIGVFSVSSKEIINFNAQVRPQNSDAVINIKFDQEFFTD